MISGKLVRAKARILGVATVALALSAIALPAKAQPYPSRSITMLVGYSAGGQADALARIVGKQLGENLKVSVVIENKTGANGMIAAQAAARAEPDGYTILMVTDAMVTIDPHLATSNHFDLSKAMEPVSSALHGRRCCLPRPTMCRRIRWPNSSRWASKRRRI